jgi:type I restriction enzyme S subunit
MEEQEMIVNRLKTICEPIDSAIDAATQQISLLQERKQIIINEVVTGKVKVL